MWGVALYRCLVLLGGAWLALACSSDEAAAPDRGAAEVSFDLPADSFGEAPVDAPPDDPVPDVPDAPDRPGDVGDQDDQLADLSDATDLIAGDDIEVQPDDVSADDGGQVADATDDAGHDAAADPPIDPAPDTDVAPCDQDVDCGFGFRCLEERCVELECHLGRWDANPELAIADKPCPEGFICDVLLDGGGTNACVAFERTCDFPDQCPFGFRCQIRQCVLSECTVGNQDAGYGPRPCTIEGEFCACMEDGADINGGRGLCISDFLECG